MTVDVRFNSQYLIRLPNFLQTNSFKELLIGVLKITDEWSNKLGYPNHNKDNQSEHSYRGVAAAYIST